MRLQPAIILALAQFVTRHRPSVGVSELEVEPVISQGLEVIATLRNWGEIIGEQVRVTGGPFTYKNRTIPQEPRERYIGDLFPRQTIRFTEALPNPEIDNYAFMEGDLLVRVEITYQNPIYRFLGFAESRQYRSAQTFWITQDRWGVMAP